MAVERDGIDLSDRVVRGADANCTSSGVGYFVRCCMASMPVRVLWRNEGLASELGRIIAAWRVCFGSSDVQLFDFFSL